MQIEEPPLVPRLTALEEFKICQVVRVVKMGIKIPRTATSHWWNHLTASHFRQ